MNSSESNGGSYAETLLGPFFYQSMIKNKNNIFHHIVETGESNTYGEILTRCIRVALNMRSQGVNKNDIISTCSSNTGNSCLPTIASAFLGMKSANFDPKLSNLVTVRLLDLVQPKILFVSQDALSFMEECLRKSKVTVKIVVFGKSDKYEEFSNYLTPHHLENEFKPEITNNNRDTAIIAFSSGTTGFPKGICINHYSLLESTGNNILYLTEETCDRKSSVLLSYTSLYWISSLMFLIISMKNGYARVVCSQFEALSTWKIIDEFKVNLMFLPPYQAIELLQHRPHDADSSSLEVFLTGSCHVSETLMKDLKKILPHTKIQNGYGQTELGGLIAIFDVSNPEQLALQQKKPNSCGQIRQNIEWKVVDINTEETLGPNKEGELRVKSDVVMNGYYKMDSSSAFDKDGYLKTGDIVWYDEDACFYVVDRIKEIFKFRGWHILPAMLEEVLMTHPAVKEAAVVAVPNEIDGDHPMGLVVLYDGNEEVTPKDIEIFFEKQVSDSQKLRAGVRIVKNFKRTITGKIDRRALTQMISNGQTEDISNV